MPPTRLDELLGQHLDEVPAAGERVELVPDRIVLDGPTAAAMLEVAGREPAVERPNRFLFVAGTRQSREEERRVARQAAAWHLPLALEPGRAGLPGVVAADEGLVSAEMIVVGTRPDVAALGALGCVVLRASAHELAGLLGGEPLRTVVPRVLAVRIEGRVPRWMGGFDLAVRLLEELGAPRPGGRPGPGLPSPAAGPGRPAWEPGVLLELSGPAIERLTVPERLATVATLALAGVAAILSPDAASETWLAARRGKGRRPAEPVEAGSEPHDEATAPGTSLQARKIGFAAVAAGERLPVGAEPGRRVSDVLLVGRVEELRAAAEVLRERNVRRGLALHVVPASARAFRHAIEEGLAADFLRAGAILRPPLDFPEPPPRGELRVSTWPADPRDVLAGPTVAAASAVAGELTDPESMRRGHRRTARRH